MAYSTFSSTSLAEASRRSRHLYYQVLRALPVVIEKFNVGFPEADIRKLVKQEFIKNKGITDIQVIDYLNFRGQLELEEVTQMWKQKPHLFKFLHSSHASSQSRISDQDTIDSILSGIQK